MRWWIFDPKAHRVVYRERAKRLFGERQNTTQTVHFKYVVIPKTEQRLPFGSLAESSSEPILGVCKTVSESEEVGSSHGFRALA